MGLFGKKSKGETEASPIPVAPVPAPAARVLEPRAPEPRAQAPEPAPSPVRQSEPTAAEPQANGAASAAPQGPPLSQEQVQKAIGESQQAMLAVGQIMTFLVNAEDLRNTTLQQIRALVWPAVSHQQLLVAMAQSNQTGHITPVGLALWANVSEEIDARLTLELDQPFNLTHQDWNSGPHTWLIMLAGEDRAIMPLVADMQKTRMGGRELKMRIAQPDGSIRCTTFAYDPNKLAAAAAN